MNIEYDDIYLISLFVVIKVEPSRSFCEMWTSGYEYILHLSRLQHVKEKYYLLSWKNNAWNPQEKYIVNLETNTNFAKGGFSKAVLGLLNFAYDFWGVGGDVWSLHCRHMRDKFLLVLLGGASGVLRMWGQGSEDPHRRRRNFNLISSPFIRISCSIYPKLNNLAWQSSLKEETLKSCLY